MSSLPSWKFWLLAIPVCIGVPMAMGAVLRSDLASLLIMYSATLLVLSLFSARACSTLYGAVLGIISGAGFFGAAFGVGELWGAHAPLLPIASLAGAAVGAFTGRGTAYLMKGQQTPRTPTGRVLGPLARADVRGFCLMVVPILSTVLLLIVGFVLGILSMKFF